MMVVRMCHRLLLALTVVMLLCSDRVLHVAAQGDETEPGWGESRAERRQVEFGACGGATEWPADRFILSWQQRSGHVSHSYDGGQSWEVGPLPSASLTGLVIAPRMGDTRIIFAVARANRGGPGARSSDQSTMGGHGSN